MELGRACVTIRLVPVVGIGISQAPGEVCMRKFVLAAAAVLVLGGCSNSLNSSTHGLSVAGDMSTGSVGSRTASAPGQTGFGSFERGSGWFRSNRKAVRKRNRRISRRHRVTSKRKAEIMAAARSHASNAGVPQDIGLAVIRQESSFNPKATGAVGEIGLMQIKCETARSVGYYGACAGLYDANTNMKFGMRYLKKALDRGSVGYYNSGIYAKRLPWKARRYARQVEAKRRSF